MATWRVAMNKAIETNRSLANSRYVQLATVRPDGRPANRTVVFRGFRGTSDDLTFVTDSRSNKVVEIAQNPWGEVAWYFPQSREQFRVSGPLRVITQDELDSEMQQARVHAWNRMSEAGRSQFAWPEPGIARLEDDSAFDVDKALIAENTPPLPTFCLVVLRAMEVDHLHLKKNRRRTHKRLGGVGGETWESMEVNP